MSTTATRSDAYAGTRQEIAGNRLPQWTWAVVAVGALILVALLLWVFGAGFNLLLVLALAVPVFLLVVTVLSAFVEGKRPAIARLAKYLVTSFFLVALVPLGSLIYEVLARGSQRFDWDFFTRDQSLAFDASVPLGAAHAIAGTIVTTGLATLISVPIGLLTAIYLVEYGRDNRLSFLIRFFVDVMTGIPSIVAGLFAFAMASLLFQTFFQVDQFKLGISGAIALSVLMIPTIVRSTEEMLKLVPNELREASYALGTPKWRTILRIVLPTSLAGIITGVVLGVARIVGETAPLLVASGWFILTNWNPFQAPMATLPVFVYQNVREVSGNRVDEMVAVGWTGSLVLILSVMLLNLIGRLIAWKFAPKPGR